MGKRRASVNRKNCVACGACMLQCPREAITIHRGCYAIVDPAKCIGCGLCVKACPANAMELNEIRAEEQDGSK